MSAVCRTTLHIGYSDAHLAPWSGTRPISGIVTTPRGSTKGGFVVDWAHRATRPGAARDAHPEALRLEEDSDSKTAGGDEPLGRLITRLNQERPDSQASRS
jgi:hypothetical protein